MLKVYAKLLPDVPYVPLLYPNLGRQHRESILFLNSAFDDLRDPFVEITDDPARADYLLLPHNFPSVRDRSEYLGEYEALSRRLGKPVLVFAHGDADAPVPLPNATVLRTSQYGYKKLKNEIMMPAYTEDLLGENSLTLRPRSEKPIVGFCGWANYKNFRNRMGTYLNNFFVQSKCVLRGSSRYAVHQKGLTLRRKALSVLQKNDQLRTNFLLRDSYSAHAKTITMDPAQARREYVQNLLASDLALCIKGDGNYSLRFYEALSLGRVPLFLETDSVLPLADVIRYDEFLIRVPFKDLSRIDRVTMDRWKLIDAEKFTSMQQRAREAFENYLSVKSFLRYAVEKLL